MKKYNFKTFIIVFICTLVALALLYFAIVLISNQDISKDSNINNNSPPGFLEIIDGDTFQMPDGEIIRLLCVDTPEKGAEGYDEATVFLTQRLMQVDINDINAELTLEGNETDAYGRSLRWVYVNNSLINKEIIDLGYGSLFEYGGEDCERAKEK